MTALTSTAGASLAFEVKIDQVSHLGVISPLFDHNLSIALLKPLDALKGKAGAPSALFGLGTELEMLDLAIVLLKDNTPVFANAKAQALLLNPPGPWEGILGLVSSKRILGETEVKSGQEFKGTSNARDAIVTTAEGRASSNLQGIKEIPHASLGTGSNAALPSLNDEIAFLWQSDNLKRLFWAEVALLDGYKVAVLSSKGSLYTILACALLLSVLVPLLCLIFSWCLIFNFTHLFAGEFEAFYKTLDLLDPNEGQGQLTSLSKFKERSALNEHALYEFNLCLKSLYESAVKQELLVQKKLEDSFVAGEDHGKAFVLSLSTAPLQQSMPSFKESVFVDPKCKSTGGLAISLVLKIDDTSVAFVAAQSLWGFEHQGRGIGDRREICSYFKAQYALTCALFHAKEALLHKKSCHETLCLVNQALCLGIKNPVGVMMMAGILNERTGNYQTASAGFRSPLMVSAGSEVVELEPIPSPALGISDGTVYSSRKGILVMGDRLLWLSESLQQDLNDLKLCVDRKELHELVARSGRMGSAELLESLAEAMAGQKNADHDAHLAKPQINEQPSSATPCINTLKAASSNEQAQAFKTIKGPESHEIPESCDKATDQALKAQASLNDDAKENWQELAPDPAPHQSPAKENAQSCRLQNPGSLGEDSFEGGKDAGDGLLRGDVTALGGSSKMPDGSAQEQKPQVPSVILQEQETASRKISASAQTADDPHAGKIDKGQGSCDKAQVSQDAQGADGAPCDEFGQDGRACQGCALFPKDYAMFCLTQRAIRF